MRRRLGVDLLGDVVAPLPSVKGFRHVERAEHDKRRVEYVNHGCEEDEKVDLVQGVQ